MDMKRTLNKWVDFAVGVGLLALGSTAIAGPTSEWRYIGDFQAATSHDGLATKHFESATGLATNFGASTWNDGSSAASSSALTLDAQTAAATDASSASTDSLRRALSATTDTGSTAAVVGSPASVQLTLWNFVDNIRAQQTANQFVQLRTAAANIDYTLNDAPAPVPLPRAFWLFAGGLQVLSIARRFLRRARTGKHVRELALA